jgi:ATP-dependent helicase/nuclease subunit A
MTAEPAPTTGAAAPDRPESVPPADEPARRRLRGALDDTLFVEAGAGTGKTRELVARVVALVAAGRVRPEGLVAITFTEMAAAELRDRVRQGLEGAAGDASRPDEERARCAAAATEIDLAAIQTVHAFAGALLRRYPLEAGLPPGFATRDAVEQELAFDERFRAWLYDEVPRPAPDGAPGADGGDTPLRAAVRRVLALGLRPDQLRELARRLEEHADVLTPDATWPAPAVDTVGAARDVAATVRGVLPLLGQAKKGPEDRLVQQARRALRAAEALDAAGDELAALRALRRFGQRVGRQRMGNQKDWAPLPDGTSPVPVIRDALAAARDAADAAVDDGFGAAFARLLGHLRDLALAAAAERKRLGVATFQDLLTWARDLLRDDPDVRRRAAARYERIFVDEFQDTDPLQAEIAWFLAGDPAQATERDWRRLRLVPGKLFLVGDPKQSIYRFRRADIGLYETIYRDLAAPDWRVSLTENFRSGAPVLAWVNHHLARELRHVPGVQAPYEALRPFEGAPGPRLGAGEGGVYRVGGPVAGARADDLGAEEADLVARTARTIRGRWGVVGEDGTGVRTVRPARCADVCVLVPTRGNVRRLERAFAAAGVPYRLEGGSLVLDTQEVRDLLACLRAIDDPSDEVALVAALRSPAYACSDADLLAWVEAGATLSYLESAPLEGAAAGDGGDDPHDAGEAVEPEGGGPAAGGGPVHRAMASLRAFHQRRADGPAAETVERFVRDRVLAVGAFGQDRPREAWRRLRYVVAQARALAASGRPTLRALLDWLDTLRARSEYDAESPVPEGDEDAVRVMTVHAAKGLEFPVVLLTGLGGAGPRPRGVDVVADRLNGRVEARCGAFRTPEYDAEHEQALGAAEGARLLYVAATRARDYLVLCLSHKAGADCHAARIVAALDEAPEPYARPLELEGVGVTEPPEAGAGEAAEEQDPATAAALADGELAPEPHAEAERAWLDARAERVAALAGERLRSPAGLARRAAHADPTVLAPEAAAATVLALGDEAADADGAADALAGGWDAFGAAGGAEDAAGGLEFDAPAPSTTPVALVAELAPAGSFGAAVRAVLARVDPETLTGLEAFAGAVAGRFGMPGLAHEVARAAGVIARSDPVRGAFAAGRSWQAVPVGTRLGRTVLEGVVDLLFEHPDGATGIVVFEAGSGLDDTEAPTAAQRAAGRGAEGGAYVLAVEQATGVAVRTLTFVSASGETPVTYRDAELEPLLDAAGRALGVAPPPRPVAPAGATPAASAGPAVPDLDLFEPAWRPLVSEWGTAWGLAVAPGEDVMDEGRVAGQTVAAVRPADAGAAASPEAATVLVVDSGSADADGVCRALAAQGRRAVAVAPDAAGTAALLAALGITAGPARASPDPQSPTQEGPE